MGASEAPTTSVPVVIELRCSRLAIMICTFVAVILALVIPITKNRAVVHSFESGELTTVQQFEYRDSYNSLISSIVSALSIPKDWFIGSILPVCFLAIASNRRMQTEQTLLTGVTFMGIDVSIRYLINNGFQATHVVLVPHKMQMGITDQDIKADTTALDIMLGYTTNVSNLIPEQQFDFNYMTNTVLRNVLAPIALKPTSPECSPSDRREDTYDSSQFATGLVQSYGFPVRAWQSMMLPTNEFVEEYSIQVPMSGNITDIEDAGFWMQTDTAANMFIHAIHVSQYFFRWLDPKSTPFNISGLIKQSKQPDFVTNGNESAASHYSVDAAELLTLLPSNASENDDDYNVKFFLGAARSLFQKSLSSGVNISKDDATMAFTHGKTFRGMTYDAVTFEVPLRRNFYYRKLIMDRHDDALTEDRNATALYTNISNAGNTSDIYYELDMSADCGPNPGVCVLPRVQHYDYVGNKYQPDPQIKATAVCLNGNGTEEFQIDYQYYTVDGNKSNAHLKASWACKQKSNTSMYIVSFGSRMEGDAMYDGKAPDSAATSLDANRVTIKNPLKIYSMTVVRLEWNIVQFATALDASCLTEDENCRGLAYLLDVPVEGDFKQGSNQRELKQQYILVGENSIPTKSLSPFLYNETESNGTYSGFGTATRWVSLMTLATPSEDAMYSQKGDLLLSYNFKEFNRSSEKRKGRACSDSTEDYLNHIVNNHYYMDHGLQASYTAGMYFIFQNGVVHDIVESNGDIGLEFKGNSQKIDMTVVIPMKSLIITCVGVGIIFLGGIFAVFFLGRRSSIKIPEDITVDMITDMMINDSKYPELLLNRRFNTINFNSKFQKVQIGGLLLRGEENGPTLTLTQSGKLQTNHTSAVSSASTEESISSSKSSETNVMLEFQGSNESAELQGALMQSPAILANQEKDSTTIRSSQTSPEITYACTDPVASTELNTFASDTNGVHDMDELLGHIEAGALHSIHIDTISDAAIVHAAILASSNMSTEDSVSSAVNPRSQE